MKLRALGIALAITTLTGCNRATDQHGRPASGMSASDAALALSEPTSGAFNTEAYDHIRENEFLAVRQNTYSTFSIDVDTASYSNVRRFLNEGRLPPPDAVRIEELLNYFHYDYTPPEDDAPFAVHTELTACPWNERHWLLRIGLKGKEIPVEDRAPSNLVFLVDVSGSMEDPDKLPLLQRALRLLARQLTENDQVSMVVYAGSSGLVLPSTRGDYRETIERAIDELRAGGSTNGGEGIELAYRIAAENFLPHGSNRVILATDGDFNVGVTNAGDLTRLIEAKRQTGVFLSVLGFGAGNYNDATMEQLADRGNGNYAYIDGIDEARKVLVEQLSGTLVTIAKDVKIQIEFNPAKVSEYRLIGYENRLLRAEDFSDDAKDAGEIGAGHTVTALYELVPAGELGTAGAVDPPKYQAQRQLTPAAGGDEYCALKLRFKRPDGEESKLLQQSLTDGPLPFDQASADHQFAAAVAAFGMKLRDSVYDGNIDWLRIEEIAAGALGADRSGYRAEFLKLLQTASELREGGAGRFP